MGDTYTTISAIVEPIIYNQYVIERTATKSALFTSGIIGTDPTFDTLASSGGSQLNMPFWKDLTGNSQILDESTNLEVSAIATGKDVARLIGRGKVWGATDLAGTFAGEDPLAAIVDLTADWWSRDMQTTLINILAGVFGAASMAGNILDISSESGTDCILDAESTLDAAQKLGDARGLLTAIMLPSIAVTHLAKLDLIDYIPDSEGKPTIKTYLGKQVIEDDGLTDADGVYTGYLFGTGAIAFGNGRPKVPAAVGRNELTAGGEEYLVSRRHFLMHPRGVAWQEAACVGDTPTNAELATSSNWVRAYENKNIRIVQFKYRLAQAAGS